MNRKSETLRLRALRVTVTREDLTQWKFIVFENVDLHRFQVKSSSGGGTPRKAEKEALDRLDAWNVLRGLREMSQGPEEVRSYWPADSLDDLVSEQAAKMWEMFDRAAKARNANQEQPKKRAPKKSEVAAKRPRSMIVALPSDPIPDGLSPEEVKKAIDAQMQMVWDYAGGIPWRWKSKRRTAAGHKCDVLTFSGSEILTPGLKSIEIPAKSR